MGKAGFLFLLCFFTFQEASRALEYGRPAFNDSLVKSRLEFKGMFLLVKVINFETIYLNRKQILPILNDINRDGMSS